MATVAYCYVGSNTGSSDHQALHVLECDLQTGAAKIVQSVNGCEGTTYFDLDREGKCLYSIVSERVGGKNLGKVVRFQLEGWRIGKMEVLASLPCEAPCHLALTAGGQRLGFAAYTSATAGTVGLDGGDLRTCVFPDDAMGPNRKRQRKAFAHQVFNLPDGRLGVVDLGCDRIRFFNPVTMERDAALELKADPGDGPRHCILAQNGKCLYVLNELGSSVTAYGVGTFRRLGKWSTLPPRFNRWEADGETLSTKAAAIKLTADGKILMASNRGHDSIAFFLVQPDGTLKLKNIAKLTGRYPRDFELMPGEKFMVVGHKLSDEIQVYRFDREQCTLVPAGSPISVWRPLCFRFKP